MARGSLGTGATLANAPAKQEGSIRDTLDFLGRLAISRCWFPGSRLRPPLPADGRPRPLGIVCAAAAAWAPCALLLPCRDESGGGGGALGLGRRADAFPKDCPFVLRFAAAASMRRVFAASPFSSIIPTFDFGRAPSPREAPDPGAVSDTGRLWPGSAGRSAASAKDGAVTRRRRAAPASVSESASRDLLDASLAPAPAPLPPLRGVLCRDAPARRLPSARDASALARATRAAPGGRRRPELPTTPRGKPAPPARPPSLELAPDMPLSMPHQANAAAGSAATKPDQDQLGRYNSSYNRVS